MVVTLYNPLAHTSSQYVRVPVKNENYEVTNAKGQVVASEVVPVPWQVLALEFRHNDTQHELVFKASVNKIASFYIKKVEKVHSQSMTSNQETPSRFKKVHSLKSNAETHNDGETVVRTSVSTKDVHMLGKLII